MGAPTCGPWLVEVSPLAFTSCRPICRVRSWDGTRTPASLRQPGTFRVARCFSEVTLNNRLIFLKVISVITLKIVEW